MNTLSTLLNPGILFFILGLFAAMVRSNLAIPEAVVKFLGFYLMLSIGFKGGTSLHQSETADSRHPKTEENRLKEKNERISWGKRGWTIRIVK